MKNLVAVLLVLLCLNAFSQIPEYVQTDGLVVCYLLDGNAADASGNGNSGAIAGNVYSTTDRFGNSSGAMRFNGGCSDRIDANVNTASISGAMSFGFWVQRNGNGCIGPRILEFWSGTNGNGTMQWNWDNSTSGPLMSQHQTASSNAVSSGFGNASVANNTWVHCTYTNDGVEAKFYLDGVLVDSKPAASGNVILAGDLALGRMNHPAWDAFNGSLDEVVLYNRALTISEVMTLSNSAPLIVGCTDASACNFNPEANSDDGTCVPSGCMDAQACNYNEDAQCEGEACDYTCCPGPGCCDAGTVWNWESQTCVVAIPAYLNEPGEAAILNPCYFDSNGNGLVEVTDLMNVLSVYGLACGDVPETAEFSCGDPLGYQGYDYETVQIGEQCWFAENLRAENYQNGDAMLIGLSDAQWNVTEEGATAIYADWGNCNSDAPDVNACNAAECLNAYGRLYNYAAVQDARGLCPSGWHVSTDDDFVDMELHLGLDESEAYSTGARGTDQGIQMKADYGWYSGGHGTNSSGFKALPGGNIRVGSGGDNSAGSAGHWWTTTEVSAGVVAGRFLYYWNGPIWRFETNQTQDGKSIRCVKDAE